MKKIQLYLLLYLTTVDDLINKIHIPSQSRICTMETVNKYIRIIYIF